MRDYIDLPILIPNHLISDFLGIMVIDILHDSKNYGSISNHRLSKITDLLAETCDFKHPITKKQIKIFIFKKVVFYMCKLWKDNLKALGLYKMPNFENNDPDYWKQLSKFVKIPLKPMASFKDTFITLGRNTKSIEVSNYYYQKELLGCNCKYYSFISPTNITNSINYFYNAKSIVNNIKSWNDKSAVSLDMKSSAGLIRTITDPIGYITSICTFVDPGYNMPGMSAIRKYSNIDTNINNFSYSINLEIENQIINLFTVKYYNSFPRNNVLINVSDHLYHGTLPNSVTMSQSLKNYLEPNLEADLKPDLKPDLKLENQTHNIITMAEILENIETTIYNYYYSYTDNLYLKIFMNCIIIFIIMK